MLQPRKPGAQFFLIRLIPLALAFAFVAIAAYRFADQPQTSIAGLAGAAGAEAGVVRVLSYSGFVSSWGPGPEIIQAFEAETGIKVELNDAGDAGLLLRKMELFPTDVVIGFDQLLLDEARAARSWRPLPAQILPEGLERREKDFVPFDWGPIAFVYRRGEIEPPKSLQDLLDSRFKGTIALQDPRTSSPGQQFLFWLIDEMGADAAFTFLDKLKPNVYVVGSSWSAAYGAFTKRQAKLVLSYLTSPVYHLTQERDSTYAAAVFQTGHPVQVEYAGVPASCGNCEGAERFAAYLLKPNIQKIIMNKNYMFPVVPVGSMGAAFESLPKAPIREWKDLSGLIKRREEFFDRWRRIGL